MMKMETVLSGYGFDEASGPFLVLDDMGAAGTTRRRWFVRGAPFTLTATERRRCAGYFDLVHYESLPCPEQSPIGADVETCYACFRRTGFNPSFYNVPVETVSPQQRAYNERPHVVYLAYFAEGCVKVGISSHDRVLLRWRGQGARMAAVLISTPDAYDARRIEEQVVRTAGLPEVIRGARKRAALNEPFEPSRARLALEQTRARVADVCALRVGPFAAQDFTADYLGSHRLDPPITDLTDENPRVISGVGIGMVGDVLLTEEAVGPAGSAPSGRQFMISIKELIGSVVEVEPVAKRNAKRPAAGQLGLRFT
jgi:hypothetical protein